MVSCRGKLFYCLILLCITAPNLIQAGYYDEDGIYHDEDKKYGGLSLALLIVIIVLPILCCVFSSIGISIGCHYRGKSNAQEAQIKASQTNTQQPTSIVVEPSNAGTQPSNAGTQPSNTDAQPSNTDAQSAQVSLPPVVPTSKASQSSSSGQARP